MAYSFPVFRKGMVFKTTRLVTSEEAGRIADLIKSDHERYKYAFMSAVARKNGSIAWEHDELDEGEEGREPEQVRQRIKESYVLDFPSISFRYNGFTVKAGNSVTVCRNEKQSKIWTRLSCTRFDKNRIKLNGAEVRKFFSFAAASADPILDSLTATYLKHVNEAGVAVPGVDGYYFQLRAFNSSSITSRTLLNRLQHGLAVSVALDDEQFRPELLEYFEIASGKKMSPAKIKKSIKDGDLDVFGYKSEEHEALFTARITKRVTDLCGYGYDDEDELKSTVLSHATTKDLLTEYAQNF